MRDANPVGLEKPATLQVLNKQKRGLFLKESELVLAGWNHSTEKDFEKGSVIFNHTHKFGMKSDSPEQGHLFVKPRLCILMQSPILIEDVQDGNKIIGELGNPNVNELFYGDKNQAESLEEYKRRYQARTKSLVYILDKAGNVAHANALVLSTKGLSSTEFFSKSSGYGLFIAQIAAAYASIKKMPVSNVIFDQQEFYSQFIWEPVFEAAARGVNGNEICAIASQVVPTPENLASLAVSDQTLQFFDDLLKVPGVQEFYLTHARKEAAGLGGRYGVSDNFLPANQAQHFLEAAPVIRGDDSGEFLIEAQA